MRAKIIERVVMAKGKQVGLILRCGCCGASQFVQTKTVPAGSCQNYGIWHNNNACRPID
jgi:hypothetical protein